MDEQMMVERQVEAACTAARLSENHVIVVGGRSVFTSMAFNDHMSLTSSSHKVLAGHVLWFRVCASWGRYIVLTSLGPSHANLTFNLSHWQCMASAWLL
jgi:hypothetical protein